MRNPREAGLPLSPATRQLVCPTCGEVLGEAHHRRWPARLRISSVTGHRVEPSSVGLLIRLTQQDPDGGRRLEWLGNHAEELVYELTCRRGHTVTTSMPDLARALRRAAGRWVTPTGPLGPDRRPG